MVRATTPKTTIPGGCAQSAAAKPSDPASPNPPLSSIAGSKDLAGVRVLVVEDVAILAMLAEALLMSFGCVIAGHAATTDKALGLVNTVAIDIALLDISLREGSSFGVADALAEKGIPYIFVTALGRDRLTGGHSHAPLIQKPYEAEELRAAIRQGLGLAVAA